MRLNDSGVFLTRVLQAEFLFAFDLHHLRVMHSDFHSTKAQVSQRALVFRRMVASSWPSTLRRDALMVLILKIWGADRVAGVGQ